VVVGVPEEPVVVVVVVVTSVFITRGILLQTQELIPSRVEAAEAAVLVMVLVSLVLRAVLVATAKVSSARFLLLSVCNGMSYLISTLIEDCQRELNIIDETIDEGDFILFGNNANDYFRTTFKLPTTEAQADLLLYRWLPR
jgi:uncharacterized membrane protein